MRQEGVQVKQVVIQEVSADAGEADVSAGEASGDT